MRTKREPTYVKREYRLDPSSTKLATEWNRKIAFFNANGRCKLPSLHMDSRSPTGYFNRGCMKTTPESKSSRSWPRVGDGLRPNVGTTTVRCWSTSIRPHKGTCNSVPTYLSPSVTNGGNLRAFFERCGKLNKCMTDDWMEFAAALKREDRMKNASNSQSCSKKAHDTCRIYAIQFDHMGLNSCPPIKSPEICNLLSLRHNWITRIDQLQQMTHLVFLDFSNNRLNQISGLECLESLRVLLLAENRIRRIQGLDDLGRLELLDLHQNQICRIENLTHLTRLKVLNLANNQLTFVGGLNGLTALIDVDLRHNRIVQVDRMIKLPNLRWISLSSNKIERWSQISGLASLAATAQVTLDRNPIVSDPLYRRIVPQAMGSQENGMFENTCRITKETICPDSLHSHCMTNMCNSANRSRPRWKHPVSDRRDQHCSKSPSSANAQSLSPSPSGIDSTFNGINPAAHEHYGDNSSQPECNEESDKLFGCSLKDPDTIRLGGGSHSSGLKFMTMDEAVDDLVDSVCQTGFIDRIPLEMMHHLLIENCQWKNISPHLAKLRSALRNCKSLELINTGLIRVADVLLLADFGQVEALSVKNTVGNPIWSQSGGLWRLFVIWTLHRFLGLKQLDNKEITRDECKRAATGFYFFGSFLQEYLQKADKRTSKQRASTIMPFNYIVVDNHINVDQINQKQILTDECKKEVNDFDYGSVNSQPNYSIEPQQSCLSTEGFLQWTEISKVAKNEYNTFVSPTTGSLRDYFKKQGDLLKVWSGITNRLIGDELKQMRRPAPMV